MAKDTFGKAVEASRRALPADRFGADCREYYQRGWVDGFNSGRRHEQRRIARKFKLSLRMDRS